MKKETCDIALSVYDEKMLSYCYPSADYEMKKNFLATSEFERLKPILKKIDFEVENVRRVCLGDEMIYWLALEKLENNEQYRSFYVNSVSDEEAEALWKKHNRDSKLYLTLLPIVLNNFDSTQENKQIPPINTIKLPQDLVDRLSASVAKTNKLKNENVLVSNKLTNALFWNDMRRVKKYKEFVESKFNNEDALFTELTSSILDVQGKNALDVFFLPVAVRLTDLKAVVTLKELEVESSFFPEIDMFDLEKIEAELNKKMTLGINLSSYLIPYEEAYQERMDFISDNRKFFV